MAKFNLLLILVSSFFLSNYTVSSDKLIILSESLLFDKNNSSAEYKGKVEIYFKNYIIFTEAVTILFEKKDKKTTISKILFPVKLKILNNNLSEILFAPQAEYSADTGIILSRGKVVIEYKKMIIATPDLYLYIGQIEDFKKL